MLNYAQDNFVIRVEADPARGMIAYPPADPEPAAKAGARNREPVAVAVAASVVASEPVETTPAEAEEVPVGAIEELEGETRKKTATRKRAPAAKKAAAGASTGVRRPRARKQVE